MTGFAHDLRFALRQLRRSPGFTAVTVLTLALGIGATTAVFSVAHAVLFRPLPFPEPDRIVHVWETNPEWSAEGRNPVSTGNFMDWRDRAGTFEALAAVSWAYGVGVIAEDGVPERVRARRGTPGIFDVLGVGLLHGGVPEEGEVAGGLRGVFLGHGFWRGRFGADPEVVGRTIDVNDEPATVLGVLTPAFSVPGVDADLWFPVGFDEEDRQSRRSHQWQVLGRLAPGTSLEAARAGMTALADRIREEHPEFMEGFGARVVPFRGDMTREVRPLLLVLLGMVGLVLLVACANVANLLTARGLTREGELTVRGALGAGRSRLLRQLLTEGVLLATLGGGAGVVLAVPATKALVAAAPSDIPLLEAARLDGAVLAVATAVVVGSTLLFGLIPAFRSSRVSLRAPLQGGRGAGGHGSGAAGLRRGFLAVQVALSAVLLVAAGLLLRSFLALHDVDPGVKTENLLAVSIDLPYSRYEGDEAHDAFYSTLLGRVEALPGVVRAAGTPEAPVVGFGNTFSFVIQGRLRRGPNPREDPVEVRPVTPGYFRTTGISVLRGRALDEGDDAGAPRVALVNRALERRLWPDGDAVGARISFDDEEPRGWVEIVGVVGDVHREGLDRPPEPALYVPYAQKRWDWMAWMTLLVRTEGDPTALTGPVREAVWALDDRLPIHRTAAVEELYAEGQARRRFAAQLLAGLAGLALLLGTVGVYSVVAHGVVRRRREFGIRMALGAEAQRIARSVLGEGVGTALLGAAAGVAVALALAGLIEGLLFGVPPRDPLTIGGVALLLVAAAAAASWIPARRATTIDPQEALRHE